MSLCSINQAISKHDKSSPPSSIMLDKYFPNILQINTHPVESKSFRIAPPTSQWYQRPNKPITATPWGQPAIGEKHLRIVLSHALHLLPNDNQRKARSFQILAHRAAGYQFGKGHSPQNYILRASFWFWSFSTQQCSRKKPVCSYTVGIFLSIGP